MKKERKASKLVRTVMALLLAFTTVFSSFGSTGIMEVKAAESGSEPAGRGTDWDFLYSEIRANGSGKAYAAGTRIYMDILAGSKEDKTHFWMDALEVAVDRQYIEVEGNVDENINGLANNIDIDYGTIIDLEENYQYEFDNQLTIKSGGYWIFHSANDENTMADSDEFFGVVASSTKDGYKDVKVSNLDIVEPKKDNGYTFDESTGTLTITSNAGTTAWRSAIGINNVKNVVIQDGVTEISNSAFAMCKGLKNIIIPTSVTSIGDYAFQASTLESITIPDGVTAIGEGAFRYCTKLVRVVIQVNGDKPATIGNSVFEDTYFVENAEQGINEEQGIQVPAGKGEIYKKNWTDWADYIYDPNPGSSTPEEKGYTFDESTGTLTITSNAGTTAWQNEISDKNVVKNVVIQDGVTEISDNAFEGCEEITSVTMPDTLTKIGASAFKTCSALESIVIPANVANIGEDAFRDCSALKEVKVKRETPAQIGYNVFEGTYFVNKGQRGINVPVGTVDTYKEKWSDWANYIDGSDSGSSGSGNLNSETKADEDSPIKDASLTNSKEELLGATGIFTDAEKQLIESGKDAKVWLQLDKVDLSTISVEDQTAINEKAKDFMGSGTELTYFDASLFKQIEGQSAEKVAEPGISMKLTIKIPTELITNDQSVDRTYSIIRLHNGTAEKIGGTFNKTTGEFSFETDKFSTYAIAYKDTAKGSGSGSSSSGSSSSSTTVNTTFKITTPASTEGGTITASKSGEITKGDTVTYTITPAEGYEIKDVLVDGKSVGAVTSYTFTNVTEAHTISAVFVKKNADDTQKPNDSTDTDTDTVTDQSKLTGSQIAKLKLPILLVTGKAGKNKVTLNWLKAKNADGYDVYWSYCDGGKNYKKLASVTNGKLAAAQKKLTNGKEYKYFVAAYKMVDGKKVYTAKSNVLHVAILGGKQTNAKSISVNKTNVVLAKNKTFKIKAQTKLENSKKKQVLHAAEYRYYTSDAKVAKVSSDGVITAKGAGSCTVYVLANNGVYKKIKVTVK